MLNNLKLLGDWDDPKNHFIANSLCEEITPQLWKNTSAVEKIKSHWIKVKNNFDVYAVSSQNSSYSFGGEKTFDQICARYPVVSNVVVDPFATTVFFTHNINNPKNYLPMTAWIIAHRIGHIIEIIKSYTEYRSSVENDFNRVVERTLVHYKPRVMHCRMEFIHLMLTMRSARIKQLTEGDIFSELFAQYLFYGQCTFNPVPSVWWPDYYENIQVKLHGCEIEELAAEWTLMAQKINQTFEKIINRLVGKILIW